MPDSVTSKSRSGSAASAVPIDGDRVELAMPRWGAGGPLRRRRRRSERLRRIRRVSPACDQVRHRTDVSTPTTRSGRCSTGGWSSNGCSETPGRSRDRLRVPRTLRLTSLDELRLLQFDVAVRLAEEAANPRHHPTPPPTAMIRRKTPAPDATGAAPEGPRRVRRRISGERGGRCEWRGHGGRQARRAGMQVDPDMPIAVDGRVEPRSASAPEGPAPPQAGWRHLDLLRDSMPRRRALDMT